MRLPKMTTRRLMILVAVGGVAMETARAYRRREYCRTQIRWLTTQIEREEGQIARFRKIGNEVDREDRAGDAMGLPPREDPTGWHRDAGKYERSRFYHI